MDCIRIWSPKKFLIDNRGEFANNLYKEIEQLISMQKFAVLGQRAFGKMAYVRGTMQLHVLTYV